MNFKNGLLLASMMFLTSSAFAGGKNIWKDCGIGALIFPNTGWAAVTSNLIWDLGTTASSTTTTSESQCAGKSASMAKFIYQNYAVIEEQTATGHGAHLVTMLNMIGCNSGSHSQIINAVRTDFSQQLNNNSKSTESQSQKAESYFNNVIDTVEGQFPKQCQLS